MTFDSIIAPLLSPYALIFLVSFLLGLAGPQFRNRRKMMGMKFAGDFSAAIYLYLMGGISGACAGMIAATGALIQALTPAKYLKKTIWPRVILAVILSFASVYFSYKTLLDILPISMVVICRFGELQSRAQHIRFVYWATCFPWMVYHYMNGFYLPLIACIFLCGSLLLSIIRHRNSPILASVID
ncbi:MAG: YgjV family protein [Pseudomonadota bacterium]